MRQDILHLCADDKKAREKFEAVPITYAENYITKKLHNTLQVLEGDQVHWYRTVQHMDDMLLNGMSYRKIFVGSGCCLTEYQINYLVSKIL